MVYGISRFSCTHFFQKTKTRISRLPFIFLFRDSKSLITKGILSSNFVCMRPGEKLYWEFHYHYINHLFFAGNSRIGKETLASNFRFPSGRVRRQRSSGILQNRVKSQNAINFDFLLVLSAFYFDTPRQFAVKNHVAVELENKLQFIKDSLSGDS